MNQPRRSWTRFPFFLILMVTGIPATFQHRLAAQQEPRPSVRDSNLITNPSVEEVSGDLPKGWIQSTWSGSPVFEIEESFAHSGKRCVKIQSSEGADASWSFRVHLKKNTDYRLSAWIKTEDIDSGGLGALINLHELQLQGKAPALRGTNDWQLVTTEFNSVNRDSLLVNLLYGGWGRATGTAWFDDVELVELKHPEKPVLSETEALTLFESKVLPVLREKCFSCHGTGEKIRGELILTNRDDLVNGGESGPTIDLDFPEDSLLLEAINYEGYEMPPDGQLSDEDIDAITQWVMAGAPWEGEGFKPDMDHDESGVPQVNEETKKWWSWQPVRRPAVPATDSDWPANEIDHYILDKLASANLEPSEAASRQTLIRRATYDLTGLPPTTAEVAAFVADDSTQAYENLLDRLLASPHYGEKWGRHWLDLVRYAESNSYERDGTKPYVWRYRDYVIRSLNEDKPYDLFLTEQLAGDEMSQVTPERIIATGYYRLGLWDDEPADPELAWYDDMDDILATTSQAMLGMTINCARCHDHKIDPVPQEDYYRMLAFFRNVRRYGVRSDQTVRDASVRIIATPDEQSRFRNEMESYVEAVKANQLALEAIEQIAMKDFIPVEHEDFKSEMNRVQLITKRAGTLLTEEQSRRYETLFEEMRRLRADKPVALQSALCVKETGSDPLETRVLIRGNPQSPGDIVEPGFPSVLSPPEAEIRPPIDGASTGRRLALANWITDPANPLTARVMVNRLWQYHFGRGIVRSSSDFGFQGIAPTHPELLDWLASEFVERNWSLKSMHKLIMMSATYRMSSANRQEVWDQDPVNDYFWRFNMRRLTAEEIRDSILSVNGTLNRETMFGPSFFPVMPPEVLQGQSMPGSNWGNSSSEDLRRRSIYVHIKRSLPVPLLANFDGADPDSPCPVRFNTVQPTQALGMINSEFLNQQSTVFAKSIRTTVADDVDQQVREILLRVTQRMPDENEIRRGSQFVKRVAAEKGQNHDEALRQFCLIALNLNEFLFLD